MHKGQQAFTLMEIMVVVIIMGIIAGMGIPKYYRMQEQGYLKDAMTQLRIIYQAQQMYKVKYDVFFPPSTYATAKATLSEMNVALAIAVNANGFSYACDRPSDDITFTCEATRQGTPAYIVRVTEAALDSSNPQCVAGSGCP